MVAERHATVTTSTVNVSQAYLKHGLNGGAPCDPEANLRANGVWVIDTGHNNGTEFHPVDVVFGPVTASIRAGDWIGALATQRGLEIDATMLAFRFATASDNRGNFWNRAKPPLSGYTSSTTFTVPFPPPPDGNIFAIASSELRVRPGGVEAVDA